ncbi:MAG: Trm112 family protein [Arsenophonus sp.]
MDHRLLNIIVCPICYGQLTYDKQNSELICKFDHIAYPIRNNIPVLLKEEARQLPLDEEK